MPKRDTPQLGAGSYTVIEAARIARVTPARLKRWISGYEFRGRSGERRKSAPVVARSRFRDEDGDLELSFFDLIELLFVKTFLDQGVSIYAIKTAAERAADLLNAEHPFCLRKFQTDGRSIFARFGAENEEPKLLDVVRNQHAFTQVFDPLMKRISYAVDTGISKSYWPMGKRRHVVLDPARSFGSPIIHEAGVPTVALAGPVIHGGETPLAVARWFDVEPDYVRAAVAYEKKHAA